MKKVLTVVLDGYGWSDNTLGNAVKMAPPNNFLELLNTYPHTLLKASEEAVGLEPGQFGNSEVGHMTIGAGRKILQSINLIRNFLDSDTLENENFKSMLDKVMGGANLHIMGLVSDGKVHSSFDHFLKLTDVLKTNGIKGVTYHVISDGRDTDTHSLYTYVSELETKLNETGVGKIGSICGRYYAMDRDKNWDRTKKYYDLITKGEGFAAPNIPVMIQKCYEKGITDEFLPPIKTKDYKAIKDGDVIIWMNYRTDRAKQIMSCFATPNFIDMQVISMPNISTYSFLPIDPKIKTKNFLVRYNKKPIRCLYI